MIPGLRPVLEYKDLARWLKSSGHTRKAAQVLKESGRIDEGG